MGTLLTFLTVFHIIKVKTYYPVIRVKALDLQYNPKGKHYVDVLLHVCNTFAVFDIQ